jgi:nitrite reductase/ring-hydroxylating ferredoxin subunit
MAAGNWKNCTVVAGYAADLADGGNGLRASVPGPAGEVPAFVIRYRGNYFAYLNRCAHQPVELDWLEGAFFDDTGEYLVCATHGAMYRPDTGLCVDGPCRGRRLEALECSIEAGQIMLRRKLERK